MVKLFRISSVADSLSGYKNVHLSWFVEKRSRPLFGEQGELGIPYKDVIVGYDERDKYRCYSEKAAEELFTDSEAAAFAQWARVRRNDTPTIEEVKLPLPVHVGGYGAIALGGGVDNLLVGHADDYDLPFKVAGFYDVSDCEFDATLPGARRAWRGLRVVGGKVEPWLLGVD